MRQFDFNKADLGFLFRRVFRAQNCEASELRLSIELEDKLRDVLGTYAEAVDKIAEQTEELQRSLILAGKDVTASVIQDNMELENLDAQYGNKPAIVYLEKAELDFLKKYFPGTGQDGRVQGTASRKIKLQILEIKEKLEAGGTEVKIKDGKVVPATKEDVTQEENNTLPTKLSHARASRARR